MAIVVVGFGLATPANAVVGDLTTVAGSPTGQFGYLDAQGTNARFNGGAQLAVFGGFTYVADFANNAVRRIDGSGNVTTWPSGYTSFNFPTGLAVNTGGNVYVGNRVGNTVQKIDTAGIVTTVAGTGAAGSNDGAAGAAVTQATFNLPQGLLFDATSNSLYIADSLGGSNPPTQPRDQYRHHACRWRPRSGKVDDPI